MAYADLVEGAESGGNPNASNPNSTSSGPAGFIDSTWLATLSKYRPDLVEGRSREDLLALKSDRPLALQMADALGDENAGILAKAGLPNTTGTRYLAHFAGPQGAIGLLNADPSTPAVAVLGEKVLKANPFLANMTAADVAAWAERKMGGKGAASSSAPQRAPFSLAPPPAAAADQAPAPAPQQAEAGGSTYDPRPIAPIIADAPMQPAPMLLPRKKIAFNLPAVSRGYLTRG